MIRFFDIFLSFVGLIVLSPLFLLISLFIIFSSPGGIFFIQTRVGRNNKDFRLIKFRTMKVDSEKQGLLTVGSADSRITVPGRWLRKYKLDELPQLFNVLMGDMSLVGPRPEVRKYVDMYTPEQTRVLSVRPGLTDWASLEYFHENDLLSASEDPEETYIREIMPAKININFRYIDNPSVASYFKVLIRTFTKISSAP
jgi:lipopolysaccharide/colanic/teichoic acid biosynthesis glycosyltransferase